MYHGSGVFGTACNPSNPADTVGSTSQSFKVKDENRDIEKGSYIPGTPNSQTTIYKWLFQLDDSQSLHGKWLFHQTSIYKWLFGGPGIYIYTVYKCVCVCCPSFPRKKLRSPQFGSTSAHLTFQISEQVHPRCNRCCNQ